MSTLYYNAAVDNTWDNVGNWWTDAGFTIPASSIPVDGDTAYIEGLVSTGPSTGVTLATLFLSQSSSSGEIDDSGSGITVSGIFTIGVLGVYTGVVGGFAGISCATVNVNGGSITGSVGGGDVTFNAGSVGVGGTVTGNIIFNGGFNEGFVGNNVIFNGYSQNSGTATSEVIFNDSSNNYYGTVDGDAVFNDSSYSYNSFVTGTATFAFSAVKSQFLSLGDFGSVVILASDILGAGLL